MADQLTPDEVYMQMLGRLDVHRALIVGMAQLLPYDAQVGLMNKLNLFASRTGDNDLDYGQSEEAKLLQRAFALFGFRSF